MTDQYHDNTDSRPLRSEEPTLPPTQSLPVYGYQRPRKGASRRRNIMGACLAISGAFIAFGCVASIVAAILLPSIYRGMEPLQQQIWCSRAERINANFVCDWKPTPPFEFLPTIEAPDSDIDPFSILTPETATPDLTGGGSPAEPANQTGAISTPFDVALQPETTATPSPTFTSTILPPTATAIPATPTTPPTATLIPIPVSHKLDTTLLTPQFQTWNNCGPATLSMGLSFFGYRKNQSVAASYLKPNAEDKNVSPYQMVNYVNQQVTDYNVNALYRVGGDLQLLKTLIANDFPVVIEKGYDVDDLGWMGHYLFVIGYDDIEQVFYTYDSYLGHGNTQGLKEDYTELEGLWRNFNYTFIVLYPPERRNQLFNLLGTRADPLAAAYGALEVARQQASDNPADNWAWFNLGSSYTMVGEYDRAAQAFDQAFIAGMPWRTLWYLFTPYTAYYAVGRYDDIIAHSQATESTTVYVEETFYYRGAALAAEGKTQDALDAFNTALRYNNNFEPARIARDALQNGSFTPRLVLDVGLSG